MVLGELPLEGTLKEVSNNLAGKVSSEVGALFFLVVIVGSILYGLKWYVRDRPRENEEREERKAARDREAQLTNVVALLVPTVTAVKADTAATRHEVQCLWRMMHAGVRALQKINDANEGSPDIAAELGEMRGALGELDRA